MAHKEVCKMYKKMLVPLDGSELAEEALIYAQELAGRLDIDIDLFHVCTPEDPEILDMHRVYVEREAEILANHVRETQQKSGAPTEGRQITVRGEVAVGHPAEEILNYSEINHIDFILIATHGRSGVKRWVLGSVADKIIQASTVPVWLIRVGIPEEIVYERWPKNTVHTILVPLDGPELAETILPHVEAIVKQHGVESAKVVLLNVCEPLDLPPFEWASIAPQVLENLEQEMDRCEEASAEYLQGIEKRLRDAGLNVRSEVLAGNIADEIIYYAHLNLCNLIAMSTHGHSGLSRWTYGSIAGKVLYGANNPIFLVRPHKT